MLPTQRTRTLVTWSALLVCLAACSTEPSVPTTITLDQTAISFTSIGQTQQVSASVKDQRGEALAQAAVNWTTSDNTVSVVSSSGLVTAQGPGSAELTATAGSATATAQIAVVQQPTELQKISGDGQTATAGQPLAAPFVVQVNDALGHPISGTTVTFAVTQGGGSVSATNTTSAPDGRASATLTTGSSVGPQQVSARVGSDISVSFSATSTVGAPAMISIFEGENQQALVGTAVPIPPAVTVKDPLGNRVPGVAVLFEVASGGGEVTDGMTATDGNGVARVGSWTLGPNAGTNTLHATAEISGLSGNPVTFTATGKTSAFNIKLRYVALENTSQKQVFEEAKARWEDLIIGDLQNISLTVDAGTCGDNSPLVNEVVDDVLILVTIQPIDGPGGVLGSAGPCFIRTSNDLTVMGAMFFDVADFAELEADGLAQEVVLHEMGHVLGFGSLWDLKGLLADPALSGGTDPHFIGPGALNAFDQVGGAAYAGAKVPVENIGGEGTADGHWRESVFGNELMTGFINLEQNPLSIVTVASLADLGYAVNLSAADSYLLSLGLRAGPTARSIQLGNDRFRAPIRRVDATGRVTEVLQH